MNVSHINPFSLTHFLRIFLLSLLSTIPVLAQPATPAPTAATASQQGSAPQQANKDATVVVLGYHRFEDRPRDTLAINPQTFREQMQTLKSSGIPVISLKDFLAWRKGEKAIPPRSALITIDDGYLSGYTVAWPILKELGYPFVMYIYTNYVNVGGKSMTWEQLREMRDAGVEFGNHSASHDNMVRPKKLKGGNYQEWLKNELFGSKQILESQLNVPITTFAFPYGIHNAQIREDALKNGYEAMFTVNPVPIRFSSPAGALGRFIISSAQPTTFKNALRALEGSGSAFHEIQGSHSSSLTVVTDPKNDETIHDPLPEIKADLTPFGDVQPDSIRLAISSFGPVSANYDPKTKQLTYKVTRPLREKNITVFLSAKNATGSVGTTWTFHYAPK